MGAMQSVCGMEVNQKEIKKIKELQKQNRKKSALQRDLRDQIQRLEQKLAQKKIKENERVNEEPTQEKQKPSLQIQVKQVNQSINSEGNLEDSEKQRLNRKVKEYEAKISDFEKSMKQKAQDEEKQQLAIRLKQYEGKISELERLMKQKVQINQKEKFTNLIEDYESKISALKNQILQKESQNQELEYSLRQVEERDKDLQKKQEDLQRMICNLRDELEVIRQKEQKEEQRYQKLILQMNQKIRAIQSQKQQINVEINRTKHELSQKQHKLHQNSKQSQQQNKKIAEEMKHNVEKYENKLKERDYKIQKLNQQLFNVQKSKKIQDPIHGLKQKLDQSIMQLDRVRLSRNRMSRAVAEMRFNHFFNAQLLQEQSDYRQFLVKTIQTRMNKKLVKTKLIYKYDELNKINIHKYIDNKYFIVLVVKLENGYYLAAFTEGPFFPKMQSKYDGLIISLSNRRAFVPLIQNKRAIAYDDFFVIFGNSQVRLKSQQKKIFSNFAISNGYYNTNGQKVNILLGTNTREVGLESYEFYQLSFKQ